MKSLSEFFSKRKKVISIIAGVVILAVAAAGALMVFLGGDAPKIPVAAASGWVPLHPLDQELFQAVRSGAAEEAARCLREGADAHAVDENGVTPVKAAVALGRSDVIREFARADPSASAEEWPGLLIYAVVQGRAEAVREIARLPVSLNELDKNGFTPLLYAIGRGNPQVIRELLNAGAAVEARGKDGVTPLMAAVMRGRHQVVAELLKAGANWRVLSPSGETAIGIARQGHRDAIVALLLEAENPSGDIYEEYMNIPGELNPPA